ncbi:hypothetical protein [Methylophaga sp.]|uniref:hypothetical protein n=1 Tax=Methylophaga sp. TaxID=2024840 RepID=UPI003A8CADDE
MSFYVLAVKRYGVWSPELSESTLDQVYHFAEMVHCDGDKITDKKILSVTDATHDLSKQISQLNNDDSIGSSPN